MDRLFGMQIPPDPPTYTWSSCGDDRVPFACPVCHSQKTVSKPPWVAGDVNTWVSGGVENYPCPTCNETGIVWRS